MEKCIVKAAQNTTDSKVAQSPHETRKIDCLTARKDLQTCDDLSLPQIFSESQYFIENDPTDPIKRFVLENKTRRIVISMSMSRCGCKLKRDLQLFKNIATEGIS